MSDSLSHMFCCIKNAFMVKKEKIEIPYSNVKVRVLNVLKKERCISNYRIYDVGNGIKRITIYLLYLKDGSSIMNNIKRISKPSFRKYQKAKDVVNAYANNGFYILSTSRGIITSYEAREKNVGGEVICLVW